MRVDRPFVAALAVAQGVVLTLVHVVPSLLPHTHLPPGDALAHGVTAPVVCALFVVYGLVSFMLVTVMRRFGSSEGRLVRMQSGVSVIVVAVALVARLFLTMTHASPLLFPAAVLPLWIALYVGRRAALLVNLGTAVIVTVLSGFDVTVLAVLLTRGIASTLTFLDRKHPRSMLLAGLAAGIAGALVHAAFAVAMRGGYDLVADMHNAMQSETLACLLGGVLGGAIAWIAGDPAGTVLGAVSRADLVDLCDLGHPLLRKMAAEAPGSWQHARAMANLAEDAAAAIGADAMLTRTGAYFHDLGKTYHAGYFIENLEPGDRSPHEGMAPDESAKAIMKHVSLGTHILRDGGVPEPVVEFVYTHHGTQVVEFFWHKCLQQGNPKKLTEEDFRYHGMKPQTRETAILMLIDSIEAASRTIDPPERDKFEEMIQRVIFTKMRQGQLDESGLSISDLRTLTASIADTLVKVYHHRIKYPWQRRAEPPPAAPEPTEKRAASSVHPVVVSPATAEPEQVSNGAAHTESPAPEGPRASEPPPPPR